MTKGLVPLTSGPTFSLSFQRRDKHWEFDLFIFSDLEKKTRTFLGPLGPDFLTEALWAGFVYTVDSTGFVHSALSLGDHL